jgi:hypothetical protein
LLHLTELALFLSNITTSHYRVLHDQLDRIEVDVVSFEMADQQGHGKGNPNDIHIQAPGSSGTLPHPYGKEVEPLGVEAGSNTGDVCTLKVNVNYDTGVRSARVAQAEASINTSTSPAVSQGTSQVFTPHLYQRFPHPLSHLLKDLNVVDGADVSLSFDVLLKVLKIRQVGQMTDSATYEIVYPYCRGELLAFVTKAVTGIPSFETFHAQLLGQFIPSRQLSRLRVERYERVQDEKEPLASYVQSIRDAT